MKLMKRPIMFLMSLCVLVVNAQQTPDTSSVAKADSVKYWKITTVTGFNFNQISLSNWATGGESSLSGKATINFNYCDLSHLYHLSMPWPVLADNS